MDTSVSTASEQGGTSPQLDAYQALRDFCGRLCDGPDFFFDDATRNELIELLIICALADIP